MFWPKISLRRDRILCQDFIGQNTYNQHKLDKPKANQMLNCYKNTLDFRHMHFQKPTHEQEPDFFT